MRSIGSDPIFSPTDFVAVFNQSLEIMYPSVVITGELAHFKISRDRWVYFDLIDDNASVRFFGTVTMLPGPLEDGLNIEVLGVPRLHPKFGFSVNVLSMRVVGSGSIAKANKLLEKKLLAEGIFDPSRKRTLPYPPEKIGLITSVESAAYSDFTKIINHRWPLLEVMVEDVLVQGIDAPKQIISALDKFNQLPKTPEVIVIIRGGGSQDDLAAFSNEQLVRSVASSRIPTIVGIGHESDISLAELAADLRASTPSNAAELLVPDISQEKIKTDSYRRTLSAKLESVYLTNLKDMEFKKEKISQILNNIFAQSSTQLEKNRLIFKALNPTAPLSKGFALVKNSGGDIIKSAKIASEEEKMKIIFSDGDVNVLKAKQ